MDLLHHRGEIEIEEQSNRQGAKDAKKKDQPQRTQRSQRASGKLKLGRLIFFQSIGKPVTCQVQEMVDCSFPVQGHFLEKRGDLATLAVPILDFRVNPCSTAKYGSAPPPAQSALSTQRSYPSVISAPSAVPLKPCVFPGVLRALAVPMAVFRLTSSSPAGYESAPPPAPGPARGGGASGCRWRCCRRGPGVPPHSPCPRAPGLPEARAPARARRP